jgi:hypothetical protein
MRRGGHLSKWPPRGVHRWATCGNCRPTASQSIHSAELINLRVQIRRYTRSSLLLYAIREFVRFYLGRCRTPSLHHLVGVKSPHCLKRHIQLPVSSDSMNSNDRHRLVLILNFRDAEPANLVLQSRALQSEPFGRSSRARYSSRRSA